MKILNTSKSSRGVQIIVETRLFSEGVYEEGHPLWSDIQALAIKLPGSEGMKFVRADCRFGQMQFSFHALS